MSLQKPILELREVFKQYRSGTVGLQPTTLQLVSGQLVGIVGPNGAGKSTLIHLIAGVLRPTSGQVSVNVSHPRRLAWVSQFSSIDWFLSAFGNVLLGARLGGYRGREAKRRARHALERVNLAKKAGLFPDELSGGEQRRVQVARALAQDADVLILDEPTVGLDPMMSESLMGFLQALPSEGKLVLVSSHDLSLLDSLVDSVIFVANGAVALESGGSGGKQEYCYVRVESQGSFEEASIHALVSQGIELVSANPLEFRVAGGGDDLHYLLKELTEKVTIRSIQTRRQTLHTRFLEKFQQG